MDDLLQDLLIETSENLDVVDSRLVAFEKDPTDREILDEIFRALHSLKGACGFLNLPRLEALAHAGETLLARFRDGVMEPNSDGVALVLEVIDQIKALLKHLEDTHSEPVGDDAALIARLEGMSEPPTAAEPEDKAQTPDKAQSKAAPDAEASAAVPKTPKPKPKSKSPKAAAAKNRTAASSPAKQSSTPQRATLRVPVDVVEHLMTVASELVLTRNQLQQASRSHGVETELKSPLQRLSTITAELQHSVMQTRMQPVSVAWKTLPRLVRDVARDLDKRIELTLEGEEAELDRQVLELIKDPLSHMVRNACDHGLESPAERVAAGKSATGHIHLRAYHEGGHVIIEISDDGAGLNTQRIREKVVERGLMTATDAFAASDTAIQRYIFAAGFSTAGAVTNLSGRGVGMDVVRANVESIGGSVDVASKAGEGTVFTLKIPLTLAIVSALIMEAGEQRFAIPQLSVRELVRIGGAGRAQLETIQDELVVRVRDKLLPAVRLDALLGLGDGPQKRRSASQNDQSSYAAAVLEVGAQNVCVLVDRFLGVEEIVVKPLAQALKRSTEMFSGNTVLGDGSVILILDPNRLAICNETAAKPARSAAIARQFDEQENAPSLVLFRTGNGAVMAAPLPLVSRLEVVSSAALQPEGGRFVVPYRGFLMPAVPIAPASTPQCESRYGMLVLHEPGRSVGLLVDEIIDILKTPVSLDLHASEPGLLGAAMIDGRTTHLVDLGYYAAQARADWVIGASGPGRPWRVLVLDPDSFFRTALTAWLTASGYVVSYADTIAAAETLLANEPPFDVAVCAPDRAVRDERPLRAVTGKLRRAGIPVVGVLDTMADQTNSGVTFDRWLLRSERTILRQILEGVLSPTREAA